MIGIRLKLSSLVIFVVFLILCTILPPQTEQFGLKKSTTNDPLKPKKNYPFHKITKIIHVSDDGDEIEEEYFFEKVNKADIPIVTHPVLSDAGQDDIDAEDIEVEESQVRMSSGFFGFFTGSKSSESDSKTNDQQPVEEDNDSNDADIEKNDNGIINWLKAFTSSDNADGKISSVIQYDDDDSWIQYLDRWPINAIFPFGKSERFAFPPKNGQSNDDSNENQKTPDPISDEHFMSLLGNLPSFVVNPNYISDIDCRQQLQILQRQLRGHKLWTMQMLDASAKIPSGILRGNINQFGDFDMCTHIKTIVKVTRDVSVRIKGKYCLAHIEIQYSNDELKIPVHLSHGRGLWNSHLGDPSHFAPRYSIVNWGICIPNLCPATIVRDTIDFSLRPYNHTGIHFHVEIDDDDCFIRNRMNFKNLMKRDNKVGFTVGYLMLFISLVITAAIVENRQLLHIILGKLGEFIKNFTKKTETATDIENDETNNSQETETSIPETNESTEETTENQPKPFLAEIILSFSPKRSITDLFTADKSDTKFPIFHILNIICTFMLYGCLKYLMIGHLPVLNRDKLVKSLDTPGSIIFRSPLIYLDILLMISGFLKSYQMCSEMEEKSHIFVLKRMTAKILRYLPTLYAVLFFQTWILPHLGSGPLWSNLIGRNTKFCEESMWRNLFGVQNVIDFEESCSPLTIQHAIELQLYLLTPLIVWLFYSNSDIGFMVYGGIHAMSVASRYSRTNMEQLSSTIFHGIHVSKFYRTANLLFSSPIPRATPYLIGIGAGILHKTSGNEWKDMSRVGLIAGWITAVLSIFWCFWYPMNGTNSEYVYNAIEAASYASWSPLLLGLGLGWIIFMLPAISSDDIEIPSPPLHSLLTVKPILFLSRISYPMQLVSYIVVLYVTADVKEPNRYNISDLVNFKEIATIVLFATILAITIDIPVKKIQKIILDKVLPDRSVSGLAADDNVDDVAEEHGEDLDNEEYEEEHEEAVKNEPDGGESPSPVDDIWGSDPDEIVNIYVKRNSLNSNNDWDIVDKTDQSPATDSDSNEIVETIVVKSSNTKDKPEVQQPEEEEEEEVEEDDEEEIAEEDEVIHRPDTPEKPPSPVPPPPQPSYRRRRFNNE